MTLAVTEVQLTGNGSTPWYQVQGGTAQFAHALVLAAKGNLGGGTLAVEMGLDQPTVPSPTDIITLVTSLAIGVPNTALTLPPGVRIRFTLSGATGPAVDTYILE